MNIPTSQKSLNVQMWHIAIPSILANISIPFLGLADTYIMGHQADSRYLAAIALGAMIFNLLYSSFNFLRMGTTGFTAQAAGRDDHREVSLSFVRGLITAIAIGLITILLQWLLIDGMLYFSKATEEVEGLATTYFHIRVLGAPFALINFVAVGWLLGMHQAMAALWIQIFMNLLNIALNVFFVMGLGMTVDGVAYGTLLAEISAAALSIYLILKHYRQTYDRSFLSAKSREGLNDMAAFIKMFQLNRDIFIRTSCITLTMASFTIIGTGFGKDILAANAILMNLNMLTAFGLDGFAQAAEVLVGRETGRRDVKKLRQAVIVSCKWALIASGIYTLVYFLTGEWMIASLTDIQSVRDSAAEYLPWLIILPILAVWSFMLDGIFIGATAGREMRNMMLISMVVYILALVICLPYMQNHGLWLAYTLFIVVRGVTLMIRYPQLEKFSS